MKRRFSFLLCLILTLYLGVTVFSADKVNIYNVGVKDGELHMVIGNTDKIDGIDCQIGTTKIDMVSVNPNVKIDTLLLFDNSLSIDSKYRNTISGIVSGVINTLSENEQMTIATFDKSIHYLIEDSSNKEELLNAAASITFENLDTKITDVMYQAYEDLSEKPFDGIRRVILITDGAEYSSIGITRQEMLNSLQEQAYPVYTIGCTYKNNIKELEDLFSLSRITNAKSVWLDEVTDVEQIVNTVNTCKNYQQVIIPIPQELADGSAKGIRLGLKTASGEKTITTNQTMPFSVEGDGEYIQIERTDVSQGVSETGVIESAEEGSELSEVIEEKTETGTSEAVEEPEENKESGVLEAVEEPEENKESGVSEAVEKPEENKESGVSEAVEEPEEKTETGASVEVEESEEKTETDASEEVEENKESGALEEVEEPEENKDSEASEAAENTDLNVSEAAEPTETEASGLVEESDGTAAFVSDSNHESNSVPTSKKTFTWSNNNESGSPSAEGNAVHDQDTVSEPKSQDSDKQDSDKNVVVSEEETEKVSESESTSESEENIVKEPDAEPDTETNEKKAESGIDLKDPTNLALIVVLLVLVCLLLLRSKKKKATKVKKSNKANKKKASNKKDSNMEPDTVYNNESEDDETSFEDGGTVYRRCDSNEYQPTSFEDENTVYSKYSSNSDSDTYYEDDDTYYGDRAEGVEHTLYIGQGERKKRPMESVTIKLTDMCNPSISFEEPVYHSITIGRSAKKSQIAFDYEPSISGQHCEIIRRNDRFYLVDLNSTNGTWIDDERIFDETEIYSGAILKFGRLEVVFEIL